MFRAAFGLNHETLRLGAQALLEGRGHLGESLFGAGLGGTGIVAVLEALRREADELYSPLARTKKLNVAIRGVVEARKRAQAAAMPASAWLAQEQSIREAHVERARIDDEGARLRAEERSLRRARQLVRLFAQLRAARLARASLAGVPILADDAAAERTLAESEIADAAAQIRRAEETLARLASLRDALTIPHALLAQVDAVDDVATRLGSHKKAAVDLPRVRAELRTQEEEVAEILRALGVKVGGERAHATGMTAPASVTTSNHGHHDVQPSSEGTAVGARDVAAVGARDVAAEGGASPGAEGGVRAITRLRAEVEPLRVQAARDERIRGLARDASVLLDRARNAEQELVHAESEVAVRRAQLASFGPSRARDLALLRRAAARARSLGNVAVLLGRTGRAASISRGAPRPSARRWGSAPCRSRSCRACRCRSTRPWTRSPRRSGPFARSDARSRRGSTRRAPRSNAHAQRSPKPRRTASRPRTICGPRGRRAPNRPGRCARCSSSMTLRSSFFPWRTASLPRSR